MRPAIIDWLAENSRRSAYIKFRADWREGQRDKYRKATLRRPDGSSTDLELTDAVLAQHWRGEESVGVYPIVPGERRVRWGAIDLDDHDGSVGDEELMRRVSVTVFAAADCGLRCVGERTAGGYHLWFLWDDWMPSRRARELLEQVRDLAQLPADTEIYPKEEEVAEGGYGHAIALPGARGSVPLDAELRPLTREDWISVELPLNPVQVQREPAEAERPALNGAGQGVIERIEQGLVGEGNRNDTLKALLRRMKGIHGADNEMLEIVALGFMVKHGMDEKEARSLLRWATEKLPVEDVQGFTELVQFEPKYRTSDFEPYYRLKYKGQWVHLPSFSKLRSATAVIEAVAKFAGELPDLSTAQWRQILPELWKRKVTHETEGEDAADSIWFALGLYLRQKLDTEYPEYLTVREGLLRGYPIIDEEKHRIVFMPDLVLNDLNRTKLVNGRIDRRRLLDVVRAHGGDTSTISVKGKNERIYWVPEQGIEDEFGGPQLARLASSEDVNLVTRMTPGLRGGDDEEKKRRAAAREF